MDVSFFERLYSGYAAESLVASQLFKRGFEVFRLPADFGLDLVVTNQFMVACDKKANSPAFPFALQVKSRWLKPENTVPGPSGRPETKVEFTFGNEELELILGHKNAGIVCVTYVPDSSNGVLEPFYFWLHCEQLRQTKDAGFLLSDGRRWSLAVRHRNFPTQTREELIKAIESECELASLAKRCLRRELPPRFVRNWNASQYLGFGRKARDGTCNLVFRAVSNVQMDFATFPEWQPIQGFD